MSCLLSEIRGGYPKESLPTGSGSLCLKEIGGDFKPDTDIDLLGVVRDDAYERFDIVDAEMELADNPKQPVDLVEECAIQRAICDPAVRSSRVVYAA